MQVIWEIEEEGLWLYIETGKWDWKIHWNQSIKQQSGKSARRANQQFEDNA